MENFDKKIEEILSSLDGLQQVEMPVDLERKIRQRIEKQQIKSARIVPLRTLILAAAVFAGIVILNVASLLLDDSIAKNRVGASGQKVGIQTFSTAYFTDSSLNY